MLNPICQRFDGRVTDPCRLQDFRVTFVDPICCLLHTTLPIDRRSDAAFQPPTVCNRRIWCGGGRLLKDRIVSEFHVLVRAFWKHNSAFGCGVKFLARTKA